MRLKSEIFVSALLRRVFANGDFAVVERKGAADAGAIAIRQVLRNGQECLYMPAPQFFTAESSEDRLFEQRLDRVPADDVAARLAARRSLSSKQARVPQPSSPYFLLLRWDEPYAT